MTNETTSQAVRDEGMSTVTLVQTVEEHQPEELVLRLRTEPQQQRPRVRWTNDTVDNEGLGRAKSKCCCIYKKPKKWDESSSDEDDCCETGRCRGHVEKRHDEPGPSGGGQTA
ncbi:hypothetical protein L596_015402 [Steinernema carpocapsae]|uniref:E3 ubiquitin-protein ligase PPP1R11 n=1 Tax=Steinernema carpocapsae TaxID=34508 RepID=A0A4U5NEW0_STECR|nr:hypothetical protein L596_015402 [Steinernema carpocapsae]